MIYNSLHHSGQLTSCDRSSTNLKTPIREKTESQTSKIFYNSPTALTSLTEDEYPNVHIICDLLRKKYPKELKNESNTQILLVLQLLCTSEPSHRFFVDGLKKNILHFDKSTIETFESLIKYENEETKEELASKNIDPGLRKLIAVICHEMAGLFLRDTIKIKKFNIDEKKITYYESFGHISNSGSIVEKMTLSSEILKHHYSSTRNYNVNLGRIYCKRPGDKIIHLMVRSGRSDNDSRLFKLVQYAYLSSLRSDNKPGITEDCEGNNVFQLSLYTAQDPHPVRNVIKKFKTKKKIPIDERTSLKNMLDSIENIWGGKDTIPIKVEDGNELQKKTHVFFAKKPIIKNFVLSRSAKDKQVIIESREWSAKSTLKEFDLLRNTKAVLSNATYFNFFKEFNNEVPLGRIPNKEEVLDFLSKISSIDPNTLLEDFAWKIYFALTAIKISLTNENLQGKSFLEPAAPGTSLIYHYYLSELIDTSIAVQCKAGCDRALIMVSLYLAKLQIESEYNKLIDLDNLNDDKIAEEYVSEFKDFCVHFGVPILKICRGNANMKARDKPILESLLGTLTSRSIPGLKLVTGT